MLEHMKSKKRKRELFRNALLWWLFIISLAITGSIYLFLGPQAEFDVDIRKRRLLFPMVGVIIAGLCLIGGTAGRWFRSR